MKKIESKLVLLIVKELCSFQNGLLIKEPLKPCVSTSTSTNSFRDDVEAASARLGLVARHQPFEVLSSSITAGQGHMPWSSIATNQRRPIEL